MTYRDAADKTLHEVMEQASRGNGLHGSDTIALGQALATMALVEAVHNAADYIAAAIERTGNAQR